MRWFYYIFACLLVVPLVAQKVELESDSTEEGSALEVVAVPVELVNQSWFTDRTGTAIIHFDELVETPEELPAGARGVSFIDVQVRETPDSKSGKAAAIVRFLLRETGIVTFPSLEFISETKHYKTIAQQISVGTAVRSEAMSITLQPAKYKVYVGEPLRIDLTWHCDLDASRLQSLNFYPAFFNDPSVKIVIPRSTVPEDRQVGLPIGGRRVIAQRTLNSGDNNALGKVELPLYLQLSEPGVYTLPATRLELALLDKGNRNFGQYAAHFNNSLFAPEEAAVRYQRVYAMSAPIEIEVLPMPEEGRLPGYSGLFEPVRIDVAVTPHELKVGDLMDAELQVFTDAPHGMIELPVLSQQRGLRGRFLVDDELGRLWRADGTTFRCRLRALSTGVEAFPALQIQTFDSETGEYRMRSTEPVALSVAANQGQEYIDLSSYKGASTTLSKQSEGIWHNLEANRMNDLLNTIVVCLASWFWLWLLLGVIAFILLIPVARERRRRALDAKYRARAEAYAAFTKLPESAPEKWTAFLHFLAVSFDAQGQAWTVRDSESALRQLGLDQAEIDSVVEFHRATDAQAYSVAHPPAQVKALNGIAKQVLRSVAKMSCVLFLCAGLLPHDAQAVEWSEAEGGYDQALSAKAGSEDARALYAEAAHKFQAVAESGERPGIAWYNAGNAWFQTGALGRSIAAYRQAWMYRPFDDKLVDNLNATRALALTDVPEEKVWIWLIPTIWGKALLLVASALIAVTILMYVRYARRWIIAVGCVWAIVWMGVGSLLLLSSALSGKFGVVITDSAIARKGPAYAYAQAFHEPVQDGAEFLLKEIREEWALVELTDGRECWLQLSQVQLIR